MNAGFLECPPWGDLTDTWDMCTIESYRAGENPAGYLTSENEVAWKWEMPRAGWAKE